MECIVARRIATSVRWKGVEGRKERNLALLYALLSWMWHGMKRGRLGYYLAIVPDGIS